MGTEAGSLLNGLPRPQNKDLAFGTKKLKRVKKSSGYPTGKFQSAGAASDLVYEVLNIG